MKSRNSIHNLALMVASAMGTTFGNAARALKNATPQAHAREQVMHRKQGSSKKSQGLKNGGRPTFKQNRRAQISKK